MLNITLKNIKQQKIPDNWKIAAVSPIFKKNNWRLVQNYRLVFLLNIASKFLEDYIGFSVYNYFTRFLCRQQHGFVKNRSVWTNVLTFLQLLCAVLDKDPNAETIAFYTDFSIAFDKETQFELLSK